MIGTLHWSDCVHVSEVAWELAAFVLAPLVHSTSRPVSPDQGLINTVSLSPEVTGLPTGRGRGRGGVMLKRLKSDSGHRRLEIRGPFFFCFLSSGGWGLWAFQ